MGTKSKMTFSKFLLDLNVVDTYFFASQFQNMVTSSQLYIDIVNMHRIIFLKQTIVTAMRIQCLQIENVSNIV